MQLEIALIDLFTESYNYNFEEHCGKNHLLNIFVKYAQSSVEATLFPMGHDIFNFKANYHYNYDDVDLSKVCLHYPTDPN